MYGAYHEGFNNSLNCAESVNYATENWLPHFKTAKICSCEYGLSGKEIHEQLTLMLQKYNLLEPTQSDTTEPKKILPNTDTTPSDTTQPSTSQQQSEDPRFDGIEHWPKFNEKRTRCKYSPCKDQVTAVCCTKCNVSLCFNTNRNCFRRYHEKVNKNKCLINEFC